MFHQESELPLATEPDFFGSLHSVNDVVFLAWVFFRADHGLPERKLIKLTNDNRNRMCEEYDYGGLHEDPPHYPTFYEKDRYDKGAIQIMIKKSEAKYGNS